jgi:hypothetical protein
MSADSVSNVVDGQRADALDSSDLIIDSPVKRSEVRRPREVASDSLESGLDLFQESARNPALMRMTLAAWQLAKRGLADRHRRTALDLKESHFCARTVAVFADIAVNAFIESHL